MSTPVVGSKDASFQEALYLPPLFAFPELFWLSLNSFLLPDTALSFLDANGHNKTNKNGMTLCKPYIYCMAPATNLGGKYFTWTLSWVQHCYICLSTFTSGKFQLTFIGICFAIRSAYWGVIFCANLWTTWWVKRQIKRNTTIYSTVIDSTYDH